VNGQPARLARERARRRYRPKPIKVLFVAEAPPASPQRFFYFDKVKAHDGLFLALMRWLYEEARDAELIELRERKPEFLRRFAADGYYLVDASETPMPKNAAASTKRRMLSGSLTILKKTLRKLSSEETRIVLISSAVFRVCYAPLRASGLNVINTELMDFPSTGHQREFGRKLGQLLDENLRGAILALEESVRFWAPGKENQKVRERYVAEHFLRGIGATFATSELILPEDDPPDVSFRDASFEVKDVQDRSRKRHNEYKLKLAKARQAERFGDLMEPFSPEDMPIAAVCVRLMEETQKLAGSKYPADVRSRLDLLFYLNFGMEKTWGIEDGSRPDLRRMQLEGWRSVSFLHGASTCCVLVASPAAPDFLRARQGLLIRGAVSE
jgi:hypothetical protein